MEEQNVNQTSQEQASDPVETHSDNISNSSTVPTPPEEQLRYWKRDLRYKQLTLILSFASLLISISGFILIIFSIRANYTQVSINTEQLRLNNAQSLRLEKYQRATVQNSVLSHVNNLNQVFMNKPHLRPYFYGGELVNEKDEKLALEVAATAEMMLDVFDLISGQNRYFPEYWESPEAWDEWIIDVFSTSPILRKTYDRYQDWYDEALIDLREKGQARLEEKARQGQIK